MKILAIRGADLASLAGPFAVDLEADPLVGAGLFAITGPTGAGKSTLLDALCLALFDETPRAARASKVRVGPPDGGGDALTAQDARQLLRRGAAKGHAEVDFSDAEGRRWRARWEVRKSRGRADGRHQPVSMSLTDVETAVVHGGTKSETLAEIQARIGLSFDQFRRSAMLAQGEFAAFLEADEDQRSALLEHMTGTGIYTAISRKAHDRARSEAEALGRLEARLGDLAPLSAEARAEATEAMQAASAREATARAARGEADALVHWLETAAALAAAAEQAAAAVGVAEGALAELAPLRAALDEAERIEPIRTPLAEADATQARARALAGRVRDAERSLERAALNRTAATQARVAASVGVDVAERGLSAAEPDLRRARALDEQVANAAAERTKAGERADATARARAHAATQRALALAARDAAEAERATAAAWFAAHERWRPVVDGWARWEPELARVGALFAGSRERAEATEQAWQTRADAMQAAEAARNEAEAAQTTADAAEAAVEAATEALGGTDLRSRRLRLDRASADLRAIDAVIAALDAHATASLRTAEATAEAAAATAEAGAAFAEGRKAEADLRDIALRQAEAERGAARIRTSLDLVDHRAQLVDGEPCPLCGAEAHPWAAAGGPGATLLRDAEAHVAALTAEREALLATRTGADANATNAAGRAETARDRADAEALEATAQLEAARQGRGLIERGELPGVNTGSEPWLPLREAAALHRDREEAELQAAEAAEADVRALRAEADQLREQRDRAAARARAAASAAEGADRKWETRRDAAAATAAEGATLREGLAAALDAAALEALATDPSALLAESRAQVAAWRDNQGREAAAVEQLSTARAALAAAEATAHEASTAAAAAAETHDARQAVHAKLVAERAGLLGGEAADAVGTRLARALTAARSSLEAATTADEAAARAVATWATTVDVTKQEHADAVAAAAASRAAQDAALAALGVSLAHAQAVLRREPPWRRETQATLRAAETALERASATAAERQARHAAHVADARPSPPLRDGDAPPPADLPAAQALAATWAAAHQGAIEARTEATSRLRQDDTLRERAAGLAAEVETQRAQSDRWAGLSSVIGSHDGKRFRNFAQSLTLDAVLTHANRWLVELAPRYRLARVPKTNMEIQVIDGDLAEEVRSLASLSGGESFLLSLGLALGLASLASQDTRVETLFIDEGFGTLDPASLDVALATLDQLQADGRQVGIISHVPGLAERVGVQVRVVPQGRGTSRVMVEGLS